MRIRHDRIRRARQLMGKHDLIGIMIMNPDDYRYFFGEVRSQPRAIIQARFVTGHVSLSTVRAVNDVNDSVSIGVNAQVIYVRTMDDGGDQRAIGHGTDKNSRYAN